MRGGPPQSQGPDAAADLAGRSRSFPMAPLDGVPANADSVQLGRHRPCRKSGCQLVRTNTAPQLSRPAVQAGDLVPRTWCWQAGDRSSFGKQIRVAENVLARRVSAKPVACRRQPGSPPFGRTPTIPHGHRPCLRRAPHALERPARFSINPRRSAGPAQPLCLPRPERRTHCPALSTRTPPIDIVVPKSVMNPSTATGSAPPVSSRHGRTSRLDPPSPLIVEPTSVLPVRAHFGRPSA